MLESVSLGGSVFGSDDREARQTIDEEPYNYKNSLTLKSKSMHKDEPIRSSFSHNVQWYRREF